ncbi:hypothetical protein DRO29_05150, partial [Candidatus Bathyarchaeota archaeon]
IYFDHKPTSDEIRELNDLSVSLDMDYWTPPVGSHPYGFVPAVIPANMSLIEKVASLDFVVRISSAEKPIVPFLDESVPATRADIIRDIGIYGNRYNGSGVRVAVIDTGYDCLNNQYLKEPTDRHHYIPLWFDDENIADEDGHGTHVAGIIVNSNDTYKGIAPGVDLIILDIHTQNHPLPGIGEVYHDLVVPIRDAVDKYDADVISISYGTYKDIASHRNGEDAVSHEVDYAKSKGATVIVSAGNDADDNKHIHGVIPAGTCITYRINTLENSTPHFYLVWNNSSVDLDFQLYRDGQLVYKPGDTGYHDNWNLDGKGFLDDNLEPTSPFRTGEDWTIEIINNGDSDQEFDLYQDNYGAGVTFVDATSDRTLTAPAVAEGAIAVGSYVTKSRWTDYTGQVWTYTPSVRVGELSPFSSRGPTLDGRIKPEIVAPGQAIVSASSRDASYDDRTVVDTGTHFIDSNGGSPGGTITELTSGWVVMQGTSMAAPHVTGAVALLIQEFRELYGRDPTPDEVKKIITLTANTTDLPQNFNRNAWGAGKLDVYRALRDAPLIMGLEWLRSQQNPDGSWTYSGEENVGLTAMATLAFLNYGIDENDPTVRKAIDWILSKQQADGKITNGWYHNYDTSLAVLALVATRNESYYDEIKKAVDFLIELQNDEDEGYTPDNKYYGGWPYCEGIEVDEWWGGWADLSNSQFTMLALHYAEQFNPNDKIVPDEVWDKAEIFVTRCQNREESNPDYNFYDDGGFIYQPGSTIWAGGRSYASMTTAGLWGLYTCGVSRTDGRVMDAWEWIENNYHIDQNYPIGNQFLYYYLYGLAKACVLWDVTEIGGHDWYQEMSEFLINKQEDDGHWEGTDPWEEPDTVATCWALLALESKVIPKNTYLVFEVRSPADLHVYDPMGRHVGINYTTGGVDIEIPGANYSGPGTEPQIINITNPIAGTYRVKLVGREEGNYTYTVRGLIGDR